MGRIQTPNSSFLHRPNSGSCTAPAASTGTGDLIQYRDFPSAPAPWLFALAPTNPCFVDLQLNLDRPWDSTSMALVDYASSDEDEGKEEEEEEAPSTVDKKTAPLKRKHLHEESSALPPLPLKFHDLYACTARVSTRDDPALHGGRTRVTPHVQGNWPTHLYIEWYPSTAENEPLTDIIAKLKELSGVENAVVYSCLASDLGAPLPLHISLSQPIGFPTEKKDAFIAALKESVSSSGIRPFNVVFSCLDWFPNFEKTRWFLVLRLQEPQLNGLNKLLYVSNKVVQDYDQPALYSTLPEISQKRTKLKVKGTSDELQPSGSRSESKSKVDWSSMHEVSDAFHVSIAWTLEPPSSELLATTKSLMVDGFEDVKKINFRVEEMKAKVGNVVTSIPLPKNVVERRALWGE